MKDALLNISTTSSSTKPNETESFPHVKVLLWNIHGGTRKSKQSDAAGAEEMNPDKLDAQSAYGARNLLVPRVVKKVDPDILLLQETTTDKLVDKIIKYTDRGYQQVQAGNTTESRILYSNKYTEVSKDKLFPRQSEQKTHTLNEVLQQSISNVIPKDSKRKLKGGTVQGATEVFDYRLSIVGLRVKGHPESPIMIFLSFHNVYRRADKEQIAGEFCQLVSIIQELTRCVVVGGADLNCQLSSKDFNVIDYEPTERRSAPGKKIDYFVVAPPDSAEKASVEALNFEDTIDGDFLHPLMSGLQRPGSGVPYTNERYTTALDHDPLVCEILY